MGAQLTTLRLRIVCCRVPASQVALESSILKTRGPRRQRVQFMKKQMKVVSSLLRGDKNPTGLTGERHLLQSSADHVGTWNGRRRSRLQLGRESVKNVFWKIGRNFDSWRRERA